MHLYIKTAYLTKDLRLFLSLLWEKIPEVGQRKNPGSGIEKQAKIPEVGQSKTGKTEENPGSGIAKSIVKTGESHSRDIRVSPK